MNNPQGSAPVYLHDLLHQLQTSIGSRPRPIPGKPDMMPVPVELILSAGTMDGFGAAFAVDLTEWRLLPHVPATRDPATGIVQCEQPARLVFFATLRDDLKLHTVSAEPPAPEPEPEPTPPIHGAQPIPPFDPAPYAAPPGEFDGTYPTDKSRAGVGGNSVERASRGKGTGQLASDSIGGGGPRARLSTLVVATAETVWPSPD